jgi:hypothetical protein
MKKLVPLFVCALVLSGTMGVGLVIAEGSGSADVINAAPTVDLQEIRTTTWASVATTVPDNTFHFNVSVSDVDTAADIWNTSVLLQLSSNDLPNDPTVTYEFFFNETLNAGAGDGWQIKPSTGTYLTLPITRSTWGANIINYSFEIIFNKTATDTNGVNAWHFKTTVIDNESSHSCSRIRNQISASNKSTAERNASNIR